MFETGYTKLAKRLRQITVVATNYDFKTNNIAEDSIIDFEFMANGPLGYDLWYMITDGFFYHPTSKRIFESNTLKTIFSENRGLFTQKAQEIFNKLGLEEFTSFFDTHAVLRSVIRPEI